VVSSTNKTDHHDNTDILVRVALNTINQAKPSTDEEMEKSNATVLN
jgi:hypothetical protein